MRLLFFLLVLFAGAVSARAETARYPADPIAVEADLRSIEWRAGLQPQTLRFQRWQPGPEGDSVEVVCTGPILELRVRARDVEWGPTFYYGLHRLGFLFPHPRRQLSPTAEGLRAHCGEHWLWRPRFKYRGFHLHTQHPSEWLHGFLMNRPEVADDTVRWLARNGQNVLQLVLLRPGDDQANSLRRPLKLARALGLTRGLSVSFAQIQQKSFRLIPGRLTLPGVSALAEATQLQALRAAISRLNATQAFEFLSFDPGSSEFTSSDFERNLSWMRAASQALTASGHSMFVKVHVSSNQVDPHYGNFNFLPKYAPPEVGVLPHTVMFYGLGDKYAPVYGRHDFADLVKFMGDVQGARESWYFPETSYFIGMDIDVPLLLTDTLKARADDLDRVEAMGVDGTLVFSTGQELGYWLLDWTAALLTFEDYRGDPLAALKLLGEDPRVWAPILDYQTRYLKDARLYETITAANLMDELPWVGHPIHERTILAKLARKSHRAELARQRAGLAAAVAALPEVTGVHSEELRTLLEVTAGRVRFAHAIREALWFGRHSPEGGSALALARAARIRALAALDAWIPRYSRYPELPLFERHANPTSYGFGYGYPARTLHYWEREERQVRTGNFNPFFLNLVNPLAILF